MTTRSLWWLGLTVLSAVMLVLDRATGPYVLFPITFVAPVGLAAWHLGRKAGLGFALVSSCLRSALAISEAAHGFTIDSEFFNAVIGTIVLVGEVLLVCRIADDQAASRDRTEGTQSRLAAIVSSANDAIIGKDLSGIVTSWNPGAERLFGYTALEMTGRSVKVLFPPEHVAAENAILDRIRHGEQVLESESQYIRKDGTMVTVGSTSSPIRNGAGDVVASSTILRDLTERKLAERRYERTLEAAPDAVVISNRKGIIELVNSQTLTMFGYRKDELIGKPVESLMPARSRSRHPEYREGFFVSPHVRPMGVALELYGQRKDGTEFPVEISLGPLEVEEGLLVVASIRDATARKRAEVELRQVNDRLKLVLHASGAVIWDWDAISNEFYVSEEWCRLLGFEVDELAPALESWTARLHPDDRDSVFECARRHLKERAPGDVEYRMRTKSGQYRWFRAVGQATWDETGRPLRMAGATIDITDRKLAAEQVRASLDEKETLLREIHHRVKNNLAVIGSLFFLQSTRTQNEQTLRVLEDCQDRVRAMALVHEKLYHSADLARVDFADYVRDLVNQLVASHSPTSGAIRVVFDLECIVLNVDRAIPCALILNELVTNAIKHAFPLGRSGLIEVSLHGNGKGGLIVSIADDGVGLPTEAEIQAANSLGLRLIQSLTKQLDGRFEVIRRTQGTEFRLEIEASHVLES